MSNAINIELWPKQAECFESTAQEIFYGGATRGGKSYLVRAALITWCTKIPGLQCFIFRKFYPDVIQNHMEGPDGFRALLNPFVQTGFCKITENQIRFQNGSLITLEHCATEEAVQKHQGIPKHVLVLEEVCQIAERHIRFLRTWCTMPDALRETIPAEWRAGFPKILYTGNPIGVSMGYFRRQFVKAAPKGVIFTAPDNDGGFRRQYIEARVEDNPSEDPRAVRGRVMGLGNAAEASALLEANWDAPIGEYFACYDESRHVTPDFMPPSHWFKFRSFDWGYSEPFAVYWWAVSDGVQFRDESGRDRWFPTGSLIAYREWYGCNTEEPAKGSESSNEEVALGIIERTLEHTSNITVTDSKPFQATGHKQAGRKYTIADVFKEHGVPLALGNCSRIPGWSQMRDRLIGRDGYPLLYLTESCYYARDYIPALGYDAHNQEDAQSSGEATHACDAIRLACTTRPIIEHAPVRKVERAPNASETPQELLTRIKLFNQRRGIRR